MRRGRRSSLGTLLAAATLCGLFAGCSKGSREPARRERMTVRDVDCREPSQPLAFMYPAENRTDYGPDDPKADGCVLIVPDHLFCCPDAVRATDR